MKNIAEISIAGKNVTGDVSAYLSKITYNDKEEGESDDVSLTFEDTTGVWQSSWYPSQGDTLRVQLGTSGDMLDCGLFEIDEVELELAPDTVTMKGIATGISKSLRTRNSKAFEKQSLRKIAQYFANKHQLKLTGKAGELQKIEIGRKTQDNQTDIAFLSDLAKEYGILFSVRGDQLVFIDREELNKQESILTVDRSQMSRARFRDKTSQTFGRAVVSKRNVKKNCVQKGEVKAVAEMQQPELFTTDVFINWKKY
jgi:phage protein D